MTKVAIKIFISYMLLMAQLWGKKIVTIGGPVTETVVALGAKKDIIGIDTSSTYPADLLKTLPKVGYVRSLSLEGTLSLKPDMIILSSSAGPAKVVDAFKKLGIPVVQPKGGYSIQSTKDTIKALAKALDKNPKPLLEDIDNQMLQLKQSIKGIKKRPKVLFLFARGASNIMVAGKKTGAYAAIELAGGTNAFSSFSGYKPLNPESLAKTEVDAIVMPTFIARALGGKNAVKSIKGLAQTNAVKNDAIYTVDALKTISFGPRIGEGLNELACQLHKNCP